MIRKQSIAGIFLIVLNLFYGCGGTVFGGDDSGVTIKSGTADAAVNTLGTLSLSSADIQKELQAKPWREIEMDISAFYENSLYSAGKKRYPVAFSFQNKRIIAYADCQKITANYKIEAKHISFSRLSVAPAIDLASCVESEHADDAVIALLENSFNIENMRKNEVLLSAEDFDTTVVLKR